MSSPEQAVEASLRAALEQGAALKRLIRAPGRPEAAEEAQASRAKSQASLKDVEQKLQVMSRSPVKRDVAAQQLHKLKEQKIRESVDKLSKELSDVWAEWQAEEAWRARAASDPEAEPASLEEAAPDLEQAQVARQEEVSAGEIQLHAAMVDEYVQDVSNLSQNMRDMQRALLDLAHITEAQAGSLDNIEKGMEQASASTDGAARELRVTHDRQTSMRKTLCMLLLALMLAAAICTAAARQRS
ncbi:unnamed protein product [Effrenium voratum]|uniref:t-SNARE coiled-coil homology domain-containing protein n=1 Tax=Effrenium voratum TaxID=2562239 RepID=A0AA36NM78_9DINO|nr:unnamed protein product [Effrenium voratum]